MLISKKMLAQYMDLGNIDIETLAEKITNAGFEVEGIERLAYGTNLIIGQVVECKDHPDSDHLHVCQVNVGNEVTQIVCGAPNVATGQKVIVILPGGKLNGVEIKDGVIRGQASHGMICSLLELGVDAKSLSEKQKSGIEVLGDDALVGNTDVLGYLGLDDEVLDISLTPNRNDCLATFAMAKEVGAIINTEVKLPQFSGAAKVGKPSLLRVASKSKACPLYSGKIINKIEIKESPKWMKQFLAAAGVKSINNIVDISNIVMLETGQPLHFFDLKKLAKPEIIVRDDLECTYTALDGVDYEIQKGDLMITVNDAPVAIAGVMGGDDSKIDDDTTGILIEAASFEHVAIRNTARRLNLNTDASIRYQKGIEPSAPYTAMDRAVQLLKEYGGADDIEETQYSAINEIKPKQIEVSITGINNRLGTSFSGEAMLDVLERLDLKPQRNGDIIHLQIPIYRQDLAIEADISEEIIRIIGYDDLKSTLPLMTPTAGRLNARQLLRRKIRNLLSNQGLYEALTYTLISKQLDTDALMPLSNEAIKLVSPMSEERAIIRSSIIPSLLGSVAYNANRSNKDIALFEISNVYRSSQVEERLALAISGNLQETRWLKQSVPADYYTLKGLIEALCDQLGYSAARLKFATNNQDIKHFHPYQSACVYLDNKLFGIFGLIHPQFAADYNVDKVVIGEFNLELLLKLKSAKIRFKEISKYPAITRDFALVVERSIKAEEIISSITKSGHAIISNVEVFDVYTGEHVALNQKSIALTVTFQSDNKTLTDEEINEVCVKITENLKNNLNAELRS